MHETYQRLSEYIANGARALAGERIPRTLIEDVAKGTVIKAGVFGGFEVILPTGSVQ